MLAGSGAAALLYLVVSLAPSLVGGASYKGYASDFSFDADAAHHPAWMRRLPDHVNVSSLSVPGTHDTMTYSVRKFHLQCQNWDLATQLRAGLRYVDVRARLQHNELRIFHGREPTGHSYRDVLLTLFDFLDAHPSEAIIMRLKREGPPLGRRNKRTFQQAFDHARLVDPATRAGAARHLFLYTDRARPLPTLGQLRSRVLILQDWPGDDDARDVYGPAWDGPQMALEDLWIIPSPAHLDLKWNAIRPALQRADADPLDNRRLYLAHVSASVGVLPIEAAAGTRNETYPRGMNDRTGAWVEEHRRGGVRTGVVIFDFPGRRAIEAVVAWNERFVES
ncbi:hypothetical protein E4U42_002210 [Claviceps africana]|uniref:Phosphatidylinositol-specific phospholipase C X domain-containing protein n=1 Tax=Claviceps africana TaxID=83212 RepID=A0A8K0J927_9HYPO|nr:hypothetical protein E4U42_002210 [Claviceps africana]